MKKNRKRGRQRQGHQKARTVCHQITIQQLIRLYKERKRQSGHTPSTLRGIENTLRHVCHYNPRDFPLRLIDKQYLCGFIHYLAHAKEVRHGGIKPLSKSSARMYLRILSGCLAMGVREGFIPHSPFEYIGADEMKPLRFAPKPREYLTIDEIKRLAATPMKCEAIKRAFLFACYTGLRISDISRLTWHDLQRRPEGTYLTLKMQKTGLPVSMKLSKCAMSWLPETNDGQTLFALPRFLGSVNSRITPWAKRAGIDKHVTFHTSRHTFATLELSLGADLYVVSKLLGHTSIKTTQIYAEVIDKRRDEAIDLIDRAFQQIEIPDQHV